MLKFVWFLLFGLLGVAIGPLSIGRTLAVIAVVVGIALVAHIEGQNDLR